AMISASCLRGLPRLRFAGMMSRKRSGWSGRWRIRVSMRYIFSTLAFPLDFRRAGAVLKLTNEGKDFVSQEPPLADGQVVAGVERLAHIVHQKLVIFSEAVVLLLASVEQMKVARISVGGCSCFVTGEGRIVAARAKRLEGFCEEAVCFV